MALLDDVRKSLRTTTILLDDEITDIIEGTKADLLLSGVLQSKIDTLTTGSPDPLIKRCIILDAKANFGLDNVDSEKFKTSYNSLKIHLTLSQEYTVEAVV